MKIRILGCESFGVRSMACVVKTAEMKVVIDPGTALGPKRFRLPPHPLEQEAAQEIQKQLHGEKGNKAGTVIMVNLLAEGITFVHGSDIQLLDYRAVEILCYWKPDILFIAGPPLYILGLQRDLLADIEQRLELLASYCGMVIIDHHILRSREGEAWLDRMAEIHSRAGRRNIICAADFSQRPRRLLEADRKHLYGAKEGTGAKPFHG